MAPCILVEVNAHYGRATAQAVSCWPLTAEARLRSWVSPCGIYDGRSGTGTVLLRVLQFPCQYHSTVPLHTHISPGEWTVAAVLRHNLTPSTWTTKTNRHCTEVRSASIIRTITLMMEVVCLLRDYTASYPRRLSYWCSPPCEPGEISLTSFIHFSPHSSRTVLQRPSEILYLLFYRFRLSEYRGITIRVFSFHDETRLRVISLHLCIQMIIQQISL
jgi:hypothetical protein